MISINYHVLQISLMLSLPTCTRGGLLWFKSKHARAERLTVRMRRLRLRFTGQLFDFCTLSHKDDLYACPSGYLPDCLTQLCWGTPAPRHARVAAPCLPGAHASMSRYLDCPRRPARRYPCWQPPAGESSQDSRAVPYQERDILPACPGRVLNVMIVHYATIS